MALTPTEYATQPVPKVSKLPGVISVTELVGPDTGQPTCHCTQPIDPTDFGVIVAPPRGRSPFKLVSGRLPDPSAPDQVLASFTFQQDYGVHLGSVIRVPFYALSQASAYNNATGAPPKPKGPTVDLHVVGFEATEFEFPTGTAPSVRPLHHPGVCAHGTPENGGRLCVPGPLAWTVRLAFRDSTLPPRAAGRGGPE